MQGWRPWITDLRAIVRSGRRNAAFHRVITMAGMKLHRLAEGARLRDIRERFLSLNASRRELLLTPSGRTLFRFRGFLETSLELAGSAMALELGDDTIREHIADAVDAARNWLTTETGSATRGLQTTLVDAVVDPSGRFSFETTKLEPPEPSPGAKEDWHIAVFSMVLDTLVAFGPAEAAREAAAAREEWYRSTEVVAEEAYFADVRAKNRWLLDDDAAARTACKEAVKTLWNEILAALGAGGMGPGILIT